MDNLNLDDNRIARSFYGKESDSILSEQEACRKSMRAARPRGWRNGSKNDGAVAHTTSPASITLDRRMTDPTQSEPLTPREHRKLQTERRLVAKPGSAMGPRETGDSWYSGHEED